jgi:hypothetical protein
MTRSFGRCRKWLLQVMDETGPARDTECTNHPVHDDDDGATQEMFKSQKAQRFIASSITALLAANAVVLVSGIIGDDASPVPAVSDAKTLTYIVSSDGTQTLVDPTTPAGYQAIADANKHGEQVVTVPAGQAPAAVQAQRAKTTTTTRPVVKPATNGAGAGISVPTLPDVNGVITTVVSTVNSVVGTANDTLTTATSIVEDTTGVTVPHVTVPTVPTVTVPPTTIPPTTVPPVTTPVVTTPAVTVPPALPGGGSTVVPPTTVTLPGLGG